MEGFAVAAAFGAVVLVVITLRLIAGAADGPRIESYLRERGWQLLDKSWDPFGPGWFGEKDARIYRIRYRDDQGNVHQAHVKTSMMSGVYLTDDERVRTAAPDESPRPGAADTEAELRREVERLRQRVRELENERR